MGGYLRSEYYTFCEKKFLLVFTSSDETCSSMVIQVHQDIGDTGYIQIQIISRNLDDTGIIGATVGQIHWDSDLDDTHHWDSRVNPWTKSEEPQDKKRNIMCSCYYCIWIRWKSVLRLDTSQICYSMI